MPSIHGGALSTQFAKYFKIIFTVKQLGRQIVDKYSEIQLYFHHHYNLSTITMYTFTASSPMYFSNY